MDKYQYTSLTNFGNIRLLHLQPNQDNAAPINVHLFEYSLLPSTRAMHLYEALSYSWGKGVLCESILVDGRKLSVTTNLYEALVCLRDAQNIRILWIDAVCINQENDAEKQAQIPLMPSLYSMASHVIVWLGTAKESEKLALEAMGLAAEGSYDEDILSEEGVREAILSILRREWFKRIWVVQEVGFARSIIVQCGLSVIGGHAFSLALNSRALDPVYAVSSNVGLQSLLRSTTYLMRRAAFRSRNMRVKPLGLRPLGELIDMYSNREATINHDKIFALLGMSSDDHSLDLPIDYSREWNDLFRRLLALLLHDRIPITISNCGQRAIIRGIGFVVGKVCSVQYDDHDDQQRTTVLLKDSRDKEHWMLHPSAEPIQTGDVVCRLQDTMKCMIVRPRQDFYFSVIMFAAHSPPQIEGSQRNFLLIWEWGTYTERRESQIVESHETDTAWKQRVWDFVSIMDDAEGKEFYDAESLACEPVPLTMDLFDGPWKRVDRY
ncbi:heterokaryon incompatibility protein-domain-containing protein [Podospora fimiseda]|uniref:Heterokaryon incompatibility protein-domain-containing protein n=1 Tax=Podospora fimiseda TaxID=252190 RepID=A0AAN6YS12_9PEZI|nr:heterokaryon incompatibility protein-domain-containing protein [Podospora fimiseda]